MIEVRRQRVDAATEVDVVREEDDVVPEKIRDRETVQCVAPQRETLLKLMFKILHLRLPLQRVV